MLVIASIINYLKKNTIKQGCSCEWWCLCLMMTKKHFKFTHALVSEG